MKVTVSQLRRIIKEEVEAAVDGAGINEEGQLNEITLPEMYDELIGGIEDALSNPDSQAKVLAGLRRMMGVKVSDEQLAREEEDRKKMKASGKKHNI